MIHIKIRRKESPEDRRNKLRFKRKLKRKDSKYPKGRSHKGHHERIEVNKRIRLGIQYAEHLQEFIDINQSFLNKYGRAGSLKLDRQFSIYNNSNEVLQQMTKVLYHSRVYFSPPKVKYDGHISFGAIHLLDHLFWEIGKKRKWQVEFTNLSPRERAILSNLKSIESGDVENQYEVMIYERIKINRTGNDMAPQSYMKRATDITQMIENAIRSSKTDPHYRLPLKIQQAIKSTIGEQFDNILLHAMESNFGVLCGFYDIERNEVTLLIYNFGPTIAQTLIKKFIAESGDEKGIMPDHVAEFISDVVNKHTEKKFYDRKTFTSENALTLLAIQEGISTEIDKDNTRGHGIMDFVEHCFSLSDQCKISLLSGKTCVRINNSYSIESKEVLGRPRRVIAFNANNDLLEKPDSNNVVNNTFNFNGVLIETIIPLGQLN